MINTLDPFMYYSLPWIGRIVILILLGCILFRLWQFVDDQEYPLAIKEVIGIPLCAGFVGIIVMFMATGIAFIYINFVSKVPIIYYISFGSFFLVIYTLRYVRRTHKAIHGHVNNPLAHKEDENKKEYMGKLEEEDKKFYTNVPDNPHPAPVPRFNL